MKHKTYTDKRWSHFDYMEEQVSQYGTLDMGCCFDRLGEGVIFNFNINKDGSLTVSVKDDVYSYLTSYKVDVDEWFDCAYEMIQEDVGNSEEILVAME